MSPGCVWEPFDLKEDDYWRAVEKLESLSLNDLKTRHRDAGISSEIRPDYSAPDIDNYIAWLDSLALRGYLPGGPFENEKR